jgi:hypothetical protein
MTNEALIRSDKGLLNSRRGRGLIFGGRLRQLIGG